MIIPKIIHQVWEGKEYPLPDFFKKLSETWKKYHPDWHYEIWDYERINNFISQHFPHFTDKYYYYKYKVQRWDVIRYLILYKIGGMYVDFDYECLESFERFLYNDICFFAMEPESHRSSLKMNIYFNNVLMISPPLHPFFKRSD